MDNQLLSHLHNPNNDFASLRNSVKIATTWQLSKHFDYSKYSTDGVSPHGWVTDHSPLEEEPSVENWLAAGIRKDF